MWQLPAIGQEVSIALYLQEVPLGQAQVITNVLTVLLRGEIQLLCVTVTHLIAVLAYEGQGGLFTHWVGILI